MLITVLMMSAVFLSATVIAGLLTVYQLGRVGSVADSIRATFAADAGLQRGLFVVFRCNGDELFIPDNWDEDSFTNVFCEAAKQEAPGGDLPIFYNDATYKLTIVPEAANAAALEAVKSTGRAGRSTRALKFGS